MNSIPKFPNFRNLQFEDEAYVVQLASQFPPYSDFNFVNMWSWNIDNSTQISSFNGNLIILTKDYTSQKFLINILGLKDLDYLFKNGLNYLTKQYPRCSFKNIPEEVIDQISKQSLDIQEDINSFDYILSIDNLCNMHKWRHPNAGKAISKFVKVYSNHLLIEIQDITIVSNELKAFFQVWAEKKQTQHSNYEFKAFERFLTLQNSSLVTYLLYIDDQIQGFACREILTNGFVMGHFSKANTNYAGIYETMRWKIALEDKKKKLKYINIQEDMGLSGLRESKRKLQPIYFLKKYGVEIKDINGNRIEKYLS
jgi:hypothetical protein